MLLGSDSNLNMEVKQDTRNELFKRQELVLELESDKNPSFDEVRKKISEDFSKEENLIDVYNIYGGFGKKKFQINANVYDSKEDLDNVKKLEITSKRRKEGEKAEEESSKGEGGEKVEEVSENSPEPAEDTNTKEQSEEKIEEKPADVAPVEEKEPIEEPEKKPEEAPAEDKPDEEKKAVKEEREMKEEAKE